MKYQANKLFKKISLIFAFFFVTTAAWCQFTGSSQGVLELINMEANFTEAANLSFNVKFFSTQKDSTGIYVTDSIAGIYKISGNNLWSLVDSVEQVQNAAYKVIVYNNDSALFITQADLISKTIFPNNFLDSAFLQYDVNQMSFTNLEGNSKELSITFKPESPYLSYDIYYDKITYRITKLEFKVKQNGPDYLKISLVFSNYVTTLIDNTIFSTTKYFTEVNNKYIIRPAYENYEIINPAKEIQYEPR